MATLKLNHKTQLNSINQNQNFLLNLDNKFLLILDLIMINIQIAKTSKFGVEK